MTHELDLRGLFSQGQSQSPRPTGLAALGMANTYGKTQPPVSPTAMKLMLIDLRIADCQTRRKAAIMRAATATKEV